MCLWECPACACACACPPGSDKELHFHVSYMECSGEVAVSRVFHGMFRRAAEQRRPSSSCVPSTPWQAQSTIGGWRSSQQAHAQFGAIPQHPCWTWCTFIPVCIGRATTQEGEGGGALGTAVTPSLDCTLAPLTLFAWRRTIRMEWPNQTGRDKCTCTWHMHMHMHMPNQKGRGRRGACIRSDMHMHTARACAQPTAANAEPAEATR